jgi:hypothetical protein
MLLHATVHTFSGNLGEPLCSAVAITTCASEFRRSHNFRLLAYFVEDKILIRIPILFFSLKPLLFLLFLVDEADLQTKIRAKLN